MVSHSDSPPIAARVSFTPQGFRYLKQFSLDPFPVFTYDVEGIDIEKSVFMIHEENSTVVHYELRSSNHSESFKDPRLDIRPLIAFRDYHSITHENSAINPALEERPGLATIVPYQGLPSLHTAHNAVELLRTGEWYRNFEYDAERARGLDFSEDLFNPFCPSLRPPRRPSSHNYCIYGTARCDPSGRLSPG